MADISPELVDNQTTYLARLQEKNQPYWEKIYMYRASQTELAIDSKEEFMYNALATLSVGMMQLNAGTGEITKVIYVKGIKGTVGTKIVVSPDDKVVYTGLQNKATYYGNLCRWLPGDQYIKCREFTFLNPPMAIAGLDSNFVYSVLNNYDYGEDPYRDTYLVVTDMFGSENKWTMKIPCNQDQ